MAGRVIFAARISEAPDFDSYFNDSRFMGRIDNIYHSAEGKGHLWIQQKNSYHDEDRITKDTGVNRVLISDHFAYFGSTGPEVVDIGKQYVSLIKKGQGRKTFDLTTKPIARDFIAHLEKNFTFNRCSRPTLDPGSCAECNDD